MAKERRDYPEICSLILKNLKEAKTVNELAAQVKAGWTTVDKALTFLESLGYVEKVVKRPKVYKKKHQIGLSDEFFNELALIIRRKGSRYHSVKDCVDDALRDFIRREKGIKRY